MAHLAATSGVQKQALWVDFDIRCGASSPLVLSNIRALGLRGGGASCFCFDHSWDSLSTLDEGTLLSRLFAAEWLPSLSRVLLTAYSQCECETDCVALTAGGCRVDCRLVVTKVDVMQEAVAAPARTATVRVLLSLRSVLARRPWSSSPNPPAHTKIKYPSINDDNSS